MTCWFGSSGKKPATRLVMAFVAALTVSIPVMAMACGNAMLDPKYSYPVLLLLTMLVVALSFGARILYVKRCPERLARAKLIQEAFLAVIAAIVVSAAVYAVQPREMAPFGYIDPDIVQEVRF